MATPSSPPYTAFSKDVLGRYICNGLDEALASTQGAGARPFDLIVLGGGSFGSAIAQHLLYSDKLSNHRILVLEAGPFVLPEHVQNLPFPGLDPPAPTNVDPGVPRNEVWGLPWRSQVAGGFPGLAYMVGGRSAFWGGWSPRLLDAEMPADRWPAGVVADLKGRFFDESAAQIGVDVTNDFVFGSMHRTLRQRLFDGLATVADAIPLAELPLHLTLPPSVRGAAREQQKLEAPLAVQGRGPRSGFFPLNKFSSIPLLMRAARQAEIEAGFDDRRKRLMVIPNCHAIRLDTAIDQGVGQVRAVVTNLGSIPVPERGVVVLAAGTIESTRLALLSFAGVLGYERIGTNLMAHLRSNFTFRVPRAALGVSPTGDLEASALFVKGRHARSDGSAGHFHLQITAAGVKGLGANSEAELFQKIPDLDRLNDFRAADEDHVVITLRGIGEMKPRNPQSKVALSAETDEHGVQRAEVRFGNPAAAAPEPGESPETGLDRELWAAMDQAAEEVRRVFAADGAFDQVAKGRDGLGTTHHESGTLWMGIDPADSVTTPNGRFHSVVNAYVVGPALLPTMGSPNPMLSGIALARRQAEHLVAPKPPAAVEPGFDSLFDGTPASLARWQQVGPGAFDLAEGALVARPGGDIGLLVYTAEAFDDFLLRLELRIDARGDNSGVFVRFRDPRLPGGAGDPAQVPVSTGFEVQIDELARPDGADLHRTGAIYGVPVGTSAGEQLYQRGSALQPGEWNDCEIEVRGDTYAVRLNGYRTALFTNGDAGRGLAAAREPASGFLGLQTHTGQVAFRAVRIQRL